MLWAVLEPDGVWTGRIQGVWLPGLDGLSATVPARIATFGATAALDAERLYITEPDGTLWAARLSP